VETPCVSDAHCSPIVPTGDTGNDVGDDVGDDDGDDVVVGNNKVMASRKFGKGPILELISPVCGMPVVARTLRTSYGSSGTPVLAIAIP